MTPLKDVLKKFVDESSLNFKPVDFYFAKRFLPEEPIAPFLFLAYLLKISREGHLCTILEEDNLVPSLSNVVDPLLIEGAKKLCLEGIIVKEGPRIYLKRNWEYEKKFLQELTRLKKESPQVNIQSEWLTKRLSEEALTGEQKKAIEESSSRSLSLILGGPGTGKSYTAKVLIKIFSEKIEKIAVSAPTGKATANLRAALKELEKKISIQTLHSLLNREALPYDLILVDEASMIDARVISQLFEKIKDGARLILLGDPFQLPPIEAGNFFRDLSEKKENISRLSTCLRSELKEIIELGEKVRMGNMIPFTPLLDPERFISTVGKEEKTILTPFKKGIFGSDTLNAKFLAVSSSKQNPIMITVNDSYLELFNGDIGILDEERKMGIFGKREIPQHLLPHYEYAFVISVHKSQGSEYDSLSIVLPEGSEIFGREMLYTAITRAKKKVEIFSDEKTLVALLKNTGKRLSGIS